MVSRHRITHLLFVVIVFLLVLTISATYYRYFVLKDYTIISEIDCDPQVESCFVYLCDPEYEECTGDPEEDTWYYKHFYRKASATPLCDPESEGCAALVCTEDEGGCYIENCVYDTENTAGCVGITSG